MLEIDIRKSLDGELMVAHDADLTRTAGVDVSVPDLTVEQLKKYPLLDGHGTPTTVTMLSFKEVLAWAYQKNVFLMLDVKGDFWKQVQEMLETYHMEDRCCILTFSQDSYLSAFSYLKKTAISVLVSTTDQYEDFIGYQNSNPSIMAYVTLDTPLNILDSLRNQKTFLLSDPREVWKGITTVAEKSFYENFISTLSLHILVTDFPIEVYQYFLK